MKPEIVFSDPLERAQNFENLKREQKNILDNLLQDKARAMELLKGKTLSPADQQHLNKMLEVINHNVGTIESDLKEMQASIDYLKQIHELYKQTLDNFEPKTYH